MRRARSGEIVHEAERLAAWIRSSGLGGAADQFLALVVEQAEDQQITTSILLEMQQEVA